MHENFQNDSENIYFAKSLRMFTQLTLKTFLFNYECLIDVY